VVVVLGVVGGGSGGGGGGGGACLGGCVGVGPALVGGVDGDGVEGFVLTVDGVPVWTDVGVWDD
jgi:hypothetical protein